MELSRQNDPGLFTLKISYMLFFVDNNNNIYYSHKTVNREEEITAQVDWLIDWLIDWLRLYRDCRDVVWLTDWLTDCTDCIDCTDFTDWNHCINWRSEKVWVTYSVTTWKQEMLAHLKNLLAAFLQLIHETRSRKLTFTTFTAVLKNREIIFRSKLSSSQPEAGTD